MNWQHLRAFLWLRWRLLRNQWRRGGAVNAVLMMIVVVGAVVTAVPLFVGTLALSTYLVPRAQPLHLLAAWDGLLLAFLFFWTIGLITELQRTEPLALSKFLHLPVSVNAAFLINYISSLLRLSLVVFLPVMLGFALALVLARGVAMVVVLPLLLAFLLMVTALTYQFQGWLGALMSNPRRRRTVIVVTTMVFVLICQLPNLMNAYAPWAAQRRSDQQARFAVEVNRLQQEAIAKKLGHAELLQRQKEITERQQREVQQADREAMVRMAKVARVANIVLPIGWLPLGTMALAEGRFTPALLGLLGMAAIGGASLWRAYRTTVNLYQGQATARRARPESASAAGRPPDALPLGAHLPGLSEPATAVALGALRSLWRAPEAKMVLLTPIIMTGVFGSMLFGQRHTIPPSARPLVAIGAIAFVLFGILQLMANQFGFDRDGFRVFVLCPAPRHEILLGKNVAFAPLALGMAGVLVVVVQLLCPMRADHFLAMVPQLVSMYLAFCMLVNVFSIFTPMPVAAGSLKATNAKLSTVLLQLLLFLVLFPLTQGATLLPLGFEAVLRLLGWGTGVPIYLLLALAECAVITALYYLSLRWLGRELQAREQTILEVVTNRAA